MPHINIKHFPIKLDHSEKNKFSIELTQLITKYFKCKQEVVSIALEPVDKDAWHDTVYEPEIIHKNNLLCKFPNY